MKYEITGQNEINGVRINQEAIERVSYYMTDREDLITNLCTYISQSKNPSDRHLMKEDLKNLLEWTDEYVLANVMSDGVYQAEDNQDLLKELYLLSADLKYNTWLSFEDYRNYIPNDTEFLIYSKGNEKSYNISCCKKIDNKYYGQMESGEYDIEVELYQYVSANKIMLLKPEEDDL